jgi:tRNA 2-thiocytidine biosynthesis protein TtcA
MASLEREVRRLVGRAIHRYDQIAHRDRILVAVSGGKDSLVLLWNLRERLNRIPIRYELVAVHIDMGFDPGPGEQLEAFLQGEGFAHQVVRTDYGVRAHGPENRENPCFWCARLRRTALFHKARELRCNKIAFGHNQDDFIETFLINICYSSQVACMLPRQPFFGGEIVVIRPLVLLPSATVERYRRRLGLPDIPNPCPSVDHNRRRELRMLLETLYRGNPKVRGNIFHAMSNVKHAYLPLPLK